MTPSIKGIRVDCRMLGHSGVGNVIENVCSNWIESHPDCNYEFLVRPNAPFPAGWSNRTNVNISIWDAPIYSIKEHLHPPPRPRFDIFATWCPYYNLSRLLAGKVSTTIHDVFHLDQKAQKRPLIQLLYAKTMFSFVRFRSSSISFVSNFSRDEFARLVGPINGKLTSVIWNGIGDKWFSTPLSTTQEVTPPYIVFVGNAFPHKNLSRLILATKKVRETTPIKLLWVGANHGLKNLDRDSLQLATQHSDFVTLTGKLDFAHLIEIVSNAKALAFPSIYEGFGLPPMEALARGVPAIVSDIPVHREIYSGSATFVDPFSIDSIASGIQSAINDPTPKSKRIDFASQFRWQSAAEKHFQFITQPSLA